MKVKVVNRDTGRTDFLIERVKHIREVDKKQFAICYVKHGTNKLAVNTYQNTEYFCLVYP